MNTHFNPELAHIIEKQCVNKNLQSQSIISCYLTKKLGGMNKNAKINIAT